MDDISRVVTRRTAAEVEEIAWKARGYFGLAPFDRVPVIDLMEHLLPQMLPGTQIRVAENQKLGNAEAVTHQNEPIITFSQKTYDGLYRDRPRPRMTAIHELGHLLMHCGSQSGYAFVKKYDPTIDPERQADIFAAAFLMPEAAFRRMGSIAEAMQAFGVSEDAATCRARRLKLWAMIQRKPDHHRSKKKGRSMRRAP